jgi:hypothetical protein
LTGEALDREAVLCDLRQSTGSNAVTWLQEWNQIPGLDLAGIRRHVVCIQIRRLEKDDLVLMKAMRRLLHPLPRVAATAFYRQLVEALVA